MSEAFPHEAGRRRALVGVLAGVALLVPAASNETAAEASPAPGAEHICQVDPTQPLLNDHPKSIESDPQSIVRATSCSRPSRRRMVKMPRTVIDIANDISGYATDNVVDGDTVTYSNVTDKDYYQRVWRLVEVRHARDYYGDDIDCGFGPLKLLDRAVANGSIRKRYSPNVCKDVRTRLADRNSIGAPESFNCRAHGADDGTNVKSAADTNRELFFHYNQRRGKVYGRVPTFDLIGQVNFRFKTRNWKAARIRATLDVPHKDKDYWLTTLASNILGPTKEDCPGADSPDLAPHTAEK